MRILLIASAILLNIALRCQDTQHQPPDFTALKTIGYLGAGYSWPKFVGKNFEPVGPWNNATMNQGLFFMEFRWGRHLMKNPDSTAFLGKGFILNWGMHFAPPTNNKHGRLNFSSFAIAPKFDFGVGFACIPIDSTVIGFGDGPMSFGFHMSPGVMLRASSVYVVASYDMDALMSVQPFGAAKETFNLGRGIICSPTVSLCFDNGWELLEPSIRHREGTYKYTEFHTTGISYRTGYNPSTGNYEEWRYERGYLEEKTGFYNYTIHKVDGFVGLGPVYTFYNHNNYGTTQMIGGQIGAKISLLKLTGEYLVGQKGTGNGIEDKVAQFAQYNGQTINYTAAVKASEMSFSAGLNLANLVFGRKNSIFYDDQNRATGTCFYSFVVYYKYGKMNFNGVPTYTYAGAEQSLDSLYATSTFEPSAAIDARYLPSSSTFQGIGVSLEFGLVSLGVEKLKFKDAPVANGWDCSLGVIVPVRKAIHLSRLNHRARKGEIQEGTGS